MALPLIALPGVPVTPVIDEQLPGPFGMDISEYQGPINWERLMAVRTWGGIRFVFMRAAKRLVADKLYETNRAQARALGLYVGSYHRINPDADMLDQAKLFVDTVGSVPPGELPPVLDAEDGHPTEAQLLTWLEYVESRTGLCPIIYTCPGWWIPRLGQAQAFSRHALWIAHWSARRPLACPPWKGDHLVWQWSNRGKIAGIKGPVDWDVWNGTDETLRLMAREE